MKKILILLNVIFSFCLYSMEIMELHEINKGMRGYGYTVVEGNKIEQFNFEVIAVITPAESMSKMILARLYGNPVIKSGGIAEGMSGSPMYIDEKLIGALSYTMDYDTPNVGLVTPIQYLKEIELELKTQYSDLEKDIKKDIKIEPGTSISITPVRGDIYFDNIGTVTYENDGIFFALGHNFTGKGNIKFFLNKAEIDYIVKSTKSPFKIGHSKETLGMVMQDRVYGVAGIITDNIPTYKIEMNIVKNKKRKTYNVEVIKDRNTLKVYFNKIIEALLLKEFDADDYKSIFCEYDIINNQGRFFTEKNNYCFEDNVTGNFANVLSNNILNIIENPFEAVEFEKISISLNLEKENKSAYIKDVKMVKEVFKPGSNIEIEVHYFLYQQGLKKQKIELKIPENFKVGNYNFEISTGIEDEKEWIEFNSISEYLRYYRERLKNNEISIRIKSENNEIKTTINIPIQEYCFSKYFYAKEIIIDSFDAETDENEINLEKID